MKTIPRQLLTALALWFATLSAALAVDVVRPLKSEEYAVRYAYPFELLEAVLERTRERYGPYAMEPYTEPVSIARSHQLAVEGKRINIMISDAGHKDFDEGMIPVPFPIDKGLLGYRVSLIARSNQDKVSRVSSLEDLRRLKVGQGANWGDVAIYRHNRIPVETAQTYDSLFLMLLHGRFDLFPRGATEAPQELAAYGKLYPDLAMDSHLLIKYPFPQFFYVSKSAPHLAERLRDGLEAMARDGSFDALFAKHFARRLTALRLDQRVIIELENPFLPSWVPFHRKELWFDPKRMKTEVPP